jgi:hypothetical protein
MRRSRFGEAKTHRLDLIQADDRAAVVELGCSRALMRRLVLNSFCVRSISQNLPFLRQLPGRRQYTVSASFLCLKYRLKIHYLIFDKCDEFVILFPMSETAEKKKRLRRAKIAVALQSELGRVPKEEEINQVFLLARVLYQVILGLHFQRREQKKQGQLAIF